MHLFGCMGTFRKTIQSIYFFEEFMILKMEKDGKFIAT